MYITLCGVRTIALHIATARRSRLRCRQAQMLHVPKLRRRLEASQLTEIGHDTGNFQRVHPVLLRSVAVPTRIYM